MFQYKYSITNKCCSRSRPAATLHLLGSTLNAASRAHGSLLCLGRDRIPTSTKSDTNVLIFDRIFDCHTFDFFQLMPYVLKSKQC